MQCKVGNYGHYLTFTVQDADGNAFNLTGYTVKFKIRKRGSASTYKSFTCTVTDAANGVAKYQVQSGDFDSADQYNGLL